MSSGKLVSDDILNSIVSSEKLLNDCKMVLYLDGYPRTFRSIKFFK